MSAAFFPQLISSLRDGYGPRDLRADALAGLTVAIVALPLGMALGIASGATPEQGLITVIVAGLLISLLGGSKYQVGGPTGAFVVVVFNIIDKYGYDGLILATIMAGITLIIAGALKLGTYIKHIPHNVITGFTCGIAIIIFSSQIRDLLGLPLDEIPADFIAKWTAYITHLPHTLPTAFFLSALALAIIIILRRTAPKLPGYLIAVIGGTMLTALFAFDVPTIGSMFGGIPRTLPAPQIPHVTTEQILLLLPSALTIAFLAGIESLLSAVIADRQTGQRHRSNTELVGQGVANCASALFGGLPATGALARTAANIRAGARSPVAGILHAFFVLLFMLLFAPLASYIPLSALAAILVIVAWNMSERREVMAIMRGPWPGRIIMLVTLLLTILVDITIAITAGVTLSLLFKYLRPRRPAP